MATTETGKASVESILKHYGVPGMKWGRRRSRAALDKAASKDDTPDSPEHTRSRELKTVAVTRGIRKLSNKDLQDLTQRLNLEQQYSKLMTPPDSKTKSKGRQILADKLKEYSLMTVDEVVKGQIKSNLRKQGIIPSK